MLANNRINSDWQFRCAPLPAGYAERSTTRNIRNYGEIATTTATEKNYGKISALCRKK